MFENWPAFGSLLVAIVAFLLVSPWAWALKEAPSQEPRTTIGWCRVWLSTILGLLFLLPFRVVWVVCHWSTLVDFGRVLVAGSANDGDWLIKAFMKAWRGYRYGSQHVPDLELALTVTSNPPLPLPLPLPDRGQPLLEMLADQGLTSSPTTQQQQQPPPATSPGHADTSNLRHRGSVAPGSGQDGMEFWET
ncbi:hypothetical protein GGTG_11941 [Gaeumannomyces tritici R3-111a-1]|uniref:Uncharacterized protein n=1 Tax=Gaeumannomyces tritici (strain R3-111a-1) TaxID=644352 RepID=J3PEL0_GAET3|nr:hypothetical protein GGTG_11941 [Gaeumannomyces tritici R3-111a-1]EJT70918.1 hypothetical protein GGTG_11941 [Gaeumannomyces tritici R3-111a-1]